LGGELKRSGKGGVSDNPVGGSLTLEKGNHDETPLGMEKEVFALKNNKSKPKRDEKPGKFQAWGEKKNWFRGCPVSGPEEKARRTAERIAWKKAVQEGQGDLNF